MATLVRNVIHAPCPHNAPIHRTKIRSVSVMRFDEQTCYTDPAFVFFHDSERSFNQSLSLSCHSNSVGFLEAAIGEHSVFLERSESLLHISVLSHSDEESPQLVTCEYEDCSVRSVVP